MSRSRNNTNTNTNTNNELYTNLFKFGASTNIISIFVLLYHGIYNVYNHSPIHITLVIFTLIKVIGQGMQIPYYWNNSNTKEALFNMVLIVSLYIIMLSIYSYGYFIQ